MNADHPFDHPTSATCSTRGAFTAVEMLIVLLVMGIFASVAAPKFVDTLRYQALQSAARRVKADLEHLRQTARLTSKQQTLSLLGMTYRAAASTDFNGLDPASTTYSVNLASAPYELDAATFDFNGTAAISFSAYGMPVEPGEVRLQAEGHQCRVVVDLTGEIQIENL